MSDALAAATADANVPMIAGDITLGEKNDSAGLGVAYALYASLPRRR